MAVTKAKPAPKQEEKKGEKPTLIARAKQSPDSDYYIDDRRRVGIHERWRVLL